jgi:hypothetical protein
LPPAGDGPADWTETVRRYRAGMQAYMENKWADAEREMAAAARAYPSSAVAQYSVAGPAARAGDSAAAIRALWNARTLGYHGLLQDDPDLASLHSAPEWRALADAYERAERTWRSTHTDPDKVVIHTDDIDRFWRTWDGVQSKPVAEWGPAFERDYLNAGTDGLQEYYLSKCREPRNFVESIQKRAEFYNAIRSTTMRLDADRQTLRKTFAELKRIYFDAVFPDIYFVVGQLTSGGTASNSGLLIGVEMSSVTPDTPLGSLNDWEKANVSSSERMPGLIAHELIHYQQKGSGETTLLAQALLEGAADFVAGRIARVVPNTAVEKYATGHEPDLWKRFAAEKDGTDTKFWLYGVPPVAGVPSDLGYWMGRRVCESYYSRARDKKAALRDIIEMRNAAAVYAGSEFAAPVH